MVTNELQCVKEDAADRRLSCLRESVLKECAHLALEETIGSIETSTPIVEERLRTTVSEILDLTSIARKVFEPYDPQAEKASIGLHLREDEILAMLTNPPEREGAQTFKDSRDHLEKEILKKEPQRLGGRLDMDDPIDREYDATARYMLEHLEGVTVENIKRYLRYSFEVDLNNPHYNLSLAIMRRDITPDKNPIPSEHACFIENPYGVHYSIVFNPVLKR